MSPHPEHPSARLGSWIPNPPGDVLDLGCGTGSLTLLLAQHGHRVVRVDLSPNTVDRARRKIAAAGIDARVMVGDATAPPPLDHSFDTVLSRHLVWTLPDPTAALRRWAGLPRKGGRLVLVRGRWDTQKRDDIYVDGQDALPWMGGVSAADTRNWNLADSRAIRPTRDHRFPTRAERWHLHLLTARPSTSQTRTTGSGSLRLCASGGRESGQSCSPSAP
jgi:SAM-dependent methyltransferase